MSQAGGPPERSVPCDVISAFTQASQVIYGGRLFFFLHGHIEELSDRVDEVLRLRRHTAKAENKMMVKHATLAPASKFSML